MFNAYVDFMEQWYDISCESTYCDIVMAYFTMADDCSETVCDFILNTAMAENKS